MKCCEDHISAYQVMVVIHKIDNFNDYDTFKVKGYEQSIKMMKESFVKKEYESSLMVESSKITINLLGDIVPYFKDEEKSLDIEMGYDSTMAFLSTECNKIVKEILSSYNIQKYHLFIGQTVFTEVV